MKMIVIVDRCDVRARQLCALGACYWPWNGQKPATFWGWFPEIKIIDRLFSVCDILVCEGLQIRGKGRREQLKNESNYTE